MKQKLTSLLAVLLIIFSFPLNAFAANDSKEFSFHLSVDGTDFVEVNTGDIITVVFRLKRTDSDEAYMMYAMQNEIRYDSTFFELVEDSFITSPDIVTRDIGLVDQHRELYMNYLSLSGGNLWNADTFIGSFQLRVIATAGVTKITNQDYLVSDLKNEGPYTFTCQDVTVVRSSNCVVTFETNGGSPLEDVLVYVGERIPEPTSPVRAGYTLEGWYSDIFLQNRWDFKNDIAQGNITLYAKWVERDPAPVVEPDNSRGVAAFAVFLIPLLFLLLVFFLFCKKRVKFDSCGGSPVEMQKLRKGALVSIPTAPVKPNAQFDGWYSNRALTNEWDFERNTVKKNITLYARWK